MYATFEANGAVPSEVEEKKKTSTLVGAPQYPHANNPSAT